MRVRLHMNMLVRIEECIHVGGTPGSSFGAWLSSFCYAIWNDMTQRFEVPNEIGIVAEENKHASAKLWWAEVRMVD